MLRNAPVGPIPLALSACVLLLGAAICASSSLRLALTGSALLAAALGAGMVAAAATAAGTLPVLLAQRISTRTGDALLGLGAGVMLAATAFSLIVPALQTVHQQGSGHLSGVASVAGGIAVGALLLMGADLFLERRNAAGMLAAEESERAGEQARQRRVWMFVAAICIHNIPEGWAIGVAFAGTTAAQAQALATGISIQDVPEGLVVAMALRGAGFGRLRSVAFGVSSGLVEPVAAVLGALAITASAALLPWGLAAAAGAMLYAVTHEAIPASHEHGNGRAATAGLVCGFVLMLVLDAGFGAG